MNGRNWGSAALEGQTLVFSVGSKPAFRIPLQDVGQVQQSREEVRSQSTVPTSIVPFVPSSGEYPCDSVRQKCLCCVCLVPCRLHFLLASESFAQCSRGSASKNVDARPCWTSTLYLIHAWGAVFVTSSCNNQFPVMLAGGAGVSG